MTTPSAPPAHVAERGATVNAKPGQACRKWLLVACCAVIAIAIAVSVDQYFGPRDSAPITATGYLGWDGEQPLEDNATRVSLPR